MYTKYHSIKNYAFYINLIGVCKRAAEELCAIERRTNISTDSTKIFRPILKYYQIIKFSRVKFFKTFQNYFRKRSNPHYVNGHGENYDL